VIYNILKHNTKVITQTVTAMHNMMIPSRKISRSGMRNNKELTTTVSNSIMATKALDAILGISKIRFKLMDTPTNIRPVNVEEDSATAEKKPYHFSIILR
jgi:hypothetical protein